MAESSRGIDLTIKYKEGVYWIPPADPNDPDSKPTIGRVHPDECFSGLTDGALKLESSASSSGKPVTKQITLKNPAVPGCGKKTFFFYDVLCSPDDKCEGIDNLDPGTLIDNGGNFAAADDGG